MVRLHPSSYLLYGVMLFHVLAIVAAMITSLPLLIKLGIAACVLVSLINAFRRWSQQSIYRVQFKHKQWCLIPEGFPEATKELAIPELANSCTDNCSINNSPTDNTSAELTIIGWSFWSRYLMILQIKNKVGQMSHWPVFFDACEPDDFRWFRVVVKYLLPVNSDR